jgi:ribokinase
VGRVIVVGSVNTDRVIRMQTLPLPGETVVARATSSGFGGKGANQAVVAATLGARTSLVAAIGADAAGSAAIADLREHGVAIDQVRRIPEELTGEAIVYVADDGENLIVVIPGANARLTGLDVEADLSALALEPSDVVLTCAEVSDDCLRAAVFAASGACARIVLNLAPARPLADWMLTRQTVFVLNEIEAAQVAQARSAAAALDLLVAQAGAVVVTRGAQGALVAHGKQVIDMPAPRVRLVDSTGAGDALCGAIAADLAEGASLAEAARTGVRAGAVAVTALGARGAIATRAMLANFELIEQQPD